MTNGFTLHFLPVCMEVTQIVLSIIVIFAAAKALGQVFTRFKQPALIGQILAGAVLGPSFFGLIQDDFSFDVLSTISVFFLMIVAGLEMDIGELKKAGKSAVIISLIAFFIPFEAGSYVSSIFGLDGLQSIFMGLLLSITALPVTAFILMEFKILKSKIGNTVMCAAVFNQVIAIVILGIVIQLAVSENDLAEPGSNYPIIQIGAMMAIFFASLVFGRKIFPPAGTSRRIIFVSTFGFFAPVFFGMVGAEFSIQSLATLAPMFVGLLAVAVISKMGGGWFGAKISNFSPKGSLIIGALMNGRGMMEIALASVGFNMGVLDSNLFSVAIAIGFTTTLISPLVARPFINKLVSSDNSEILEGDQQIRQEICQTVNPNNLDHSK